MVGFYSAWPLEAGPLPRGEGRRARTYAEVAHRPLRPPMRLIRPELEEEVLCSCADAYGIDAAGRIKHSLSIGSYAARLRGRFRGTGGSAAS